MTHPSPQSAQQAPGLPIGPFEPAILETDASMLAQARELRAFLIARAEGEGDTTAGHAAYCYTLKSAVESLIHGLCCQVDFAQQDLQDAPMLRERVVKLERDLDLAQQPLDAQMARLNQRVIELTAELDAVAIAKQGDTTP